MGEIVVSLARGVCGWFFSSFVASLNISSFASLTFLCWGWMEGRKGRIGVVPKPGLVMSR